MPAYFDGDAVQELFEVSSTAPLRVPGVLAAPDIPCAQQTRAAHCQSTLIGVRHEARPADSSRDDSAAFMTAPIVDIHALVYNILRSIRVVLYEAVAAQLIQPSNGYS